jgi:hypothetical protein
VVPLMYLCRNSAFYRRVIMTGGSIAIILVAAMWLWERLQPMLG